jgi:NADH-quinone oxidoreductase subunit J
MLLIASFAALAGLYVLLDAPFVAVIQIIIYAGAILVLFLFVVMLLNAPEEQPAAEPRPFQRAAGLALVTVAALGGIVLITGLRGSLPAEGPQGTAQAIGRLLAGPYLFAFEFISLLLLTAMVGALMLVKRKH